jgi:hypothetical protein
MAQESSLEAPDMDDIDTEDLLGGGMTTYIPINIPDRNMSGPFGPDFFKRKFHGFVQQSCETGDTTTILELVLVSGQALDINKIMDFDHEFMLVCCFVDEHSSELVYHSYVRYDTIFRVNVYESSPDKRPVGFNFAAYSEAAARVLDEAGKDGAAKKD